MAKNSVFYSFHFDDDVNRVQLIRNMGVIAGREPVGKNEWEKIRNSEASIKKWINETIADSDAVVVLIGNKTHTRPWVKYEISEAWRQNKPLLGVYIHNLECMRNGKCGKGKNPFDYFTYKRGGVQVDPPTVYDPSATDAYNDIAKNLAGWVAKAAKR